MKTFFLYVWYFLATAGLVNGALDIWKWIKMEEDRRKLKQK